MQMLHSVPVKANRSILVFLKENFFYEGLIKTH